MTPLRVLLVVKDSPASFLREEKPSGLFSYPVPEFTWDHIVLGGRFSCDTRQFADRFDLVFHIDGSNWGTYTGPLPVVYYSIDSTLSEEHWAARVDQAGAADLVLLDHDRPERFTSSRRVLPLPYCVNDRVYHDPGLPREIDVAAQFNITKEGGKARGALLAMLRDHCARRNYRLVDERTDIPGYAATMARAKVVVNWPRTPLNRPHRVFDALACGACLLTGPLPDVPADNRVSGSHYLERDTPAALCAALDRLLLDDAWRTTIARQGHALVMARHTWAVRARDLAAVLRASFGLGTREERAG